MHFWTRAVKFFIYKIPFWLVYKGVAISFTNHQKLGQLIMDDRGEEPSYTYTSFVGDKKEDKILLPS